MSDFFKKVAGEDAEVATPFYQHDQMLERAHAAITQAKASGEYECTKMYLPHSVVEALENEGFLMKLQFRKMYSPMGGVMNGVHVPTLSPTGHYWEITWPKPS